MTIIKSFTLALCCYISISSSFSQEFDEVGSDLGIAHQYSGNDYGGGVSFYDFNKDGWDDLTLPSGNGLYKFYINNLGVFEEVDLVADLGEVKSLIWVDMDNDGDADLSVTEFDGFIKLFRNTGNLILEEIDLNDELNVIAYNSGISWADYDGDGRLDFYVSRYPEHDEFGVLQNTTNMLYKQLSDGSFLNVTDSLDMGNGIQQSFIATWADFDDDLDVDLYISNDRFSFANAMYLNDGDGSFTDFSEESEADISIFSMTNTVDDFDNDGDLDIYSSNGHGGNYLLQNNGDATFENLFPNSGTEAFAFSWGANWIDYDNDGWKDLFLCTGSFNEDPTNRLFLNNQDGTFSTLDNFSFAPSGNAHGVAKGDFDNDGKYDLMVSFEEPYISQMMHNVSGNDHNSVKLKLEGTISNRDAIGSKVTFYTGGNLRTEYFTCGTNYISQDSQTKILGLGSSAQIDSLQVRWPSGLVHWHYDIAADSILNLIETSPLLNTQLYSNQPLYICEGGEISLSVDSIYTNVTWSNNAEGNSIVTNETGSYWAVVNLSEWYSFNTDTVQIEDSPGIVLDQINLVQPSCFGFEDGSITVNYSSETGIGAGTAELNNLISGNYYINLELENHCSTLANFMLNEPDELFVLTSLSDASCAYSSDGTVLFTPFGGVEDYEFQIIPELPLDSLVAGFYEYTCVDANNCLVEGSFQIESPTPLEYEMFIQDQIGLELGSIDLISTSQTTIDSFIVLDSLGLEQNPLELLSGSYVLIIQDEFGCVYEEVAFINFITYVTSSQKSDLKIFPNPSTGLVHISGESAIPELSIYSLDGKLIDSSSYHWNDSVLDLTHLSKGAYYIKHISESGINTNLIILE